MENCYVKGGAPWWRSMNGQLIGDGIRRASSSSWPGGPLYTTTFRPREFRLEPNRRIEMNANRDRASSFARRRWPSTVRTGGEIEALPW